MTTAAWCILVFGLLEGPTAAASDAAPAWSPDGHWLAYTLALPGPRASLPTSWLNPESGASATPELVYRLYATRPETGESALLAESSRPLSSPVWKPDGTALAFSRLVVDGDRGRIEVVVQNAPESRQVIHTEEVADLAAAGGWLAGKPLAWSPEGAYLVVPGFSPNGLTILRADMGSVLKRLDDAFSPSWSPDGKKLAFYRAGEPDGLYWLDTTFAEPRRLAETPQAARFMPPLWSKDGQMVSFARQEARAVAAPMPRIPARGKPSLSLIRMDVRNHQTETPRPLNLDPLAAGEALRAVSIVVDNEGDEMFSTSWVEGQRSRIAWSKPRMGDMMEVRNQFNPLDETTVVTSLALAPNARTLAMRLGPPGVTAPVAVYMPETDRFLPMVPDDASRAAWVGFMLGTVREVLTEWPARPDITNPPIERATPLPVPGDNVEEPTSAARALRVARFARPICTRPEDLEPIDPEFALRLDEAKLIFDYLRADYPAALADLDALEGRQDDPRSAFQRLVIRTQIAIARGELDQARDTLTYLRDRAGGPTQVVEELPLGLRLREADDPARAWLTCLSDLIAQRHLAEENGEPKPEGHVNPDAPDFEPPDQLVQPPFRRVAPIGRQFPVPVRRVAPPVVVPAPPRPVRVR